MTRWLIIPLAAASLGAAAQAPAGKPANPTENDAVTSIVECMAPGLPEDWSEAVMMVQLAKPGDENVAVQYLFARRGAAVPDERFMPCDVRTPAVALMGVRQQQPQALRGWTGARLTIFRDGKFSLKYEYPKN
ncbi:MAG TPA: hypothetical protein VF943_04220 [Burkholderiales bacterium]